jgi:hypothetical protein
MSRGIGGVFPRGNVMCLVLYIYSNKSYHRWLAFLMWKESRMRNSFLPVNSLYITKTPTVSSSLVTLVTGIFRSQAELLGISEQQES